MSCPCGKCHCFNCGNQMTRDDELTRLEAENKIMKKYINLIEKEVKDTSDVCVEICNIKDILNKARTALESADRIRRGEG